MTTYRKGQDKSAWERALRRAVRFFEKLPTCNVQHELDTQINLKKTVRAIKILAKKTVLEEKLKSPIRMANWVSFSFLKFQNESKLSELRQKEGNCREE